MDTLSPRYVRARIARYRPFLILCALAGIESRMRAIAKMYPNAMNGPCPECARRPKNETGHTVCGIAIEFQALACENVTTIAAYGYSLGIDEDGVKPMAWAVSIENRWYLDRPEILTGYAVHRRVTP
jgi:hypothetical protein